jgi:hypothetical protein
MGNCFGALVNHYHSPGTFLPFSIRFFVFSFGLPRKTKTKIITAISGGFGVFLSLIFSLSLFISTFSYKLHGMSLCSAG